ncbi:DNA repair protein RadC [Limnohabitans sp. Rim8]|uniref:RadC family protein n=1 Tax=Limnohabitans sp. Rim8 TaxID=1100718 RepID=UPI0025E19062|nr:DNA repair protein RadC [Limnohabitans sp. Rim8]
MSIKDLPLDARPREKLLARGPQALSDVELLAILLRTGMAGKNVFQLSEELLGQDGIAGLLNATVPSLKMVKGLGPAKQAELLAVFELARRALSQRLKEREAFQTPGAVKQYLQLQLAHKNHEVFAVLFLDHQNRMLAMEELFRGTLSQTSVYPREVVLRALHHQAAAVVLSHNHPSGSVQPSRADEHLTQTLKAALALVDVRVLDHIIVGQGQSLSMAEQGLM